MPTPPQPDSPPDMSGNMTLEQVAKALGIPPERIMQLVQAGILKAHKMPDGSPMFDAKDVEAIAKKLQSVGPPPPPPGSGARRNFPPPPGGDGPPPGP